MPPAFYATDCQLCFSNLGVANAAFSTKSRAQRGVQGRDGGAWWGQEKGGPSVTWAGRQLGGLGSCCEDAVSDCVESLERTDSLLGQFRRKTGRARGDAFPLPTAPPARGNNHTKAWLERRISQVLLDAVYLRTAAFSRRAHRMARGRPRAPPRPRRALPEPRPRAQPEAAGGSPRIRAACQVVRTFINGYSNLEMVGTTWICGKYVFTQQAHKMGAIS